MNIIIIDYNMGNVHSVQNAIKFIGHESALSSLPEDILAADIVILPGVGSFGNGMAALNKEGLIDPIKAYIQTGKPFLGICLGMQLLMDKSYEMGEYEGLGIVPGEVLFFSPKDPNMKVPHMGWNQIKKIKKDLLFSDISDEENVYFVHSYYVKPENNAVALAKTCYSIEFCSILRQDNVYGMQFHPEKSQKVGLQMLRNFISY
jgi:glutamine amidotransferase